VFITSQPPVPHVTPEEYLEIDGASESKHEYVFGEVVKVLGGSPRHSQITANTSIALGKRLFGTGCKVFDSSLRVCLDRETSFYVYPDLTVVKGSIECLETRDETLTNPRIVVEVLSRATLNFDLGTKARMYTRVSTLSDLLIVDQDEVGVEHWVRWVNHHWDVVRLHDLDDVLKIESVNCQIPVWEIYAGIDWRDARKV
jgi:Uma2 family endonuclease